ncbi:MAG: response regulator [Alphaproteobacteria bacterium]|nr:response regulator [Alphaproteobacteria bacterium]
MIAVSEETRVLIVDDDADIRRLVVDLLKRNGMTAIAAADVSTAEKALSAGRIDLVVLDIMMPGEDGLTFCRRLRGASNIPVIMLTALGEDVDRIVGLELGADDYLAKPFNPRELTARIKAILRRAPPLKPGEAYGGGTRYQFRNFVLDVDKRELRNEAEKLVSLTSGEFALLLALVEQSPRVLSRDRLLDLTRGAVSNPFDRSIDSQISRLRKKIEEDPRRARLIKTVRSIGYAFAGPVKTLRIGASAKEET